MAEDPTPVSPPANPVLPFSDNTQAGLLALEELDSQPRGFPPNLRQSVGLVGRGGVDRPASESEVLQFFLQAEYSREELERQANELSRLLDQSTKQTREAQLADQTKSDFLAMMSHEIRTPLNGIIGMAAILLSRDLPYAERDCIETMRNSGEALLSIVDQILDFSKIEAGRLELESREFHIAEAVEGAVQIIRNTAERKAIHLATNIDPAVPQRVRGDVGRLRQVLLNLLSNAVKFSERGTVELKVEAARFGSSEYNLRFTVTDNGIGITEEQQTRLFQPFSQADVSTARRFGGTGLGLAICKRLTELMGGEIGVSSSAGRGSSFWFTIKARQCESSQAPNEQPDPEFAGEKLRPADFRILLVEDNSVNQKVGLLMLNNLGYRADVVRNGSEALASIATQSYDLVLMDCLMPEMDGFEATRRIRSQPGIGSHVPIIAITANAFAQDREACLAAGMSDYLAKPVRQTELQQKLEFWLSGKGQPLGVQALGMQASAV